MMNLTEQINADIKSAMLAKDKAKLEPLRAIKSSLLMAATEKGAEASVSQETEMKALQKLVKQRKEAAEIYQSQGREDLAQSELEQAAVIEAYLPEQMGEEEIQEIIQEVINDAGASSMADMGKVMGACMNKLQGKADGKLVSALVKKLLG